MLNAIISAVASIQVADALKILCGCASQVQPRITTIDVWYGGIRQIDAPARDPECPTCGRREFSYLEERRRPPVTLCGRNAVQVHERERPIDLAELKARLAPLGEVRANEFALRFRDCAVRDDGIPGRPRDRQRDQRRRCSAESVCAVCGELTASAVPSCCSRW